MSLAAHGLSLRSKTVATTYYFREMKSLAMWASCTINETTGELAIQSDHGNWSYRWNASPASLGAPTLTAFIAKCGDANYLADKLTTRGERQTFSSKETLIALRMRLVDDRHETLWTSQAIRDAWDAIGDHVHRCGDDQSALAHELANDEYLEVLRDRCDFVSELFEYVASWPYKILLERILPALIEALRYEVAKIAEDRTGVPAEASP